jgi:hypothetical protein
MSHSSMLKARRQHQKTKKRLERAAKQAKRLAKSAVAGEGKRVVPRVSNESAVTPG